MELVKFTKIILNLKIENPKNLEKKVHSESQFDLPVNGRW